MSHDNALDSAQLAASTIPTGGDPFALFEEWFAMAREAEPNDANAMALATATPDGAPSVRMVLLKGHGAQEAEHGGFTFFTNAQSRKGGEIRSNMQASVLFHWKSLRRQIRIEGPLEEVSAEMADAYFHSRPRVSQVAGQLLRHLVSHRIADDHESTSLVCLIEPGLNAPCVEVVLVPYALDAPVIEEALPQELAPRHV